MATANNISSPSTAIGTSAALRSRARRVSWLARATSASFIMSAVLIILFLSIFPLVASLYVSLTRLQFVQGGFELTFVGLSNYAKLLTGIDQSRFLGKFGTPGV